MTIDERLDRLSQHRGGPRASVVAHDSQIEALVQVAERHERETKDLVREWQAYLRTPPRQ